MRQTDAVADTGNHLRDRYAIVGVGETQYTRGSNKTTRAMAAIAIRRAMHDAGLEPHQLDGMLSYAMGDSTPSPIIAADLGLQLNFHMDVAGGGSSTEALIGIAIGVIEAGMCDTIAIFRSMNGYSRNRIGGTGERQQAITDEALHYQPYGWYSPAEWFAPTFMRYMHDYGITAEQSAMVKVAHSEHASCNPKALMNKRVTVSDVLNSRVIVRPLNLLNCCLETDNASALIITSRPRAADCRHPPALIKSVVGRVCKPRADSHFQSGYAPRVAGYFGRDRLWRNADVTPADIDITGSYDAFTFTTMLQLEAYGFCEPGGAGEYVSNGTIQLGGARPNNTSGGHLCEGYTHGISMVIENVRQLRHDVDDNCPLAANGKRVHSYDYRAGGCRQLKNVSLSANLGWGTPSYGSALVMGID